MRLVLVDFMPRARARAAGLRTDHRMKQGGGWWRRRVDLVLFDACEPWSSETGWSGAIKREGFAVEETTRRASLCEKNCKCGMARERALSRCRCGRVYEDDQAENEQVGLHEIVRCRIQYIAPVFFVDVEREVCAIGCKGAGHRLSLKVVAAAAAIASEEIPIFWYNRRISEKKTCSGLVSEVSVETK